MKSCFYYLLFLLPALVFNSCSNDLDVLADYEENAAVYALLDPSQSIQFVKINKVFTNPSAKASDVAKIADSLYFDTIAPMLIGLSNGAVVQRIPLFKANVLLKNTGTFANSPNYLYATNIQLSNQYQYRLELILPKTGKMVTATTNMVTLRPTSVFNPVTITQRTLSITPLTNIALQFNTENNGKIYDAYFNFMYQEVNVADTNIKTNKVIRWKILRSFRAMSDKTSEFVTQRIPGLAFYNLLLSEIPVNNLVKRRFLPCTFEFIGANILLDNYIAASTPSIGIVQKQTDYTNISGGVGLFGSRNTLLIDNINLVTATKNTIIGDDRYKKLGFSN
jgi:hypothetical protein